MRSISSLAAITTIAAVMLCACGSDRGDPLAPGSDGSGFGGSLFSGAGLANAPATQENKYALCNLVLPPMYASYRASLLAHGSVPDIETVRIVGPIKGYALVDGRVDSIFERNGHKVAFSSNLVYHDYSADGRLFVGGTVNFNGFWIEKDGSLEPYQLDLDGGLMFAGDFSGALTFWRFRLLLDENGILIPAGTSVYGWPAKGSINLFSAQDTLSVNPYIQLGYE